MRFARGRVPSLGSIIERGAGMSRRTVLYSISVWALMVFVGGCASTPTAPEPPPVVSSVVETDFATAWTTTRDVLLAQGLEVYTRDKRGLFVAYTHQKRHLLLFPHREEFTVALEPLPPDRVEISVETIHQRYRVTLLTYPDWRDAPKGAEKDKAQALLDQIVAGIRGPEPGTPGDAKG